MKHASSFLGAITLLASGCGELTYRSEPVRVASLEVSPASLRLRVGAEGSVTVRVLDADGGLLSGRTVSVEVGDSRVAVPLGLSAARAVAEGATAIRYTTEGLAVSVPITVISAATRLSVSASRSTLYAGDTLLLTASASDASGRAVSAQNVRWSSLDPTKATVSAAGVVRGIALGRAIIVAQLGDLQEAIEFYVTDPLWWIRISPSTNTLPLGDSLQLGAVAVDSWGFALPGRVYTWRATAPLTVDVTSGGLAKARGLGWGNIAVSTGAVVVLTSIQVIPQPLASISLAPASATLRMNDRLQLTYAMVARNGRPTNADGRWVRWSAGYPLNVDNYGVVTAFAPTSGASVCVSIDDQSACGKVIVP